MWYADRARMMAHDAWDIRALSEHGNAAVEDGVVPPTRLEPKMISVVIPSFRQGKFIGGAVRSALAQRPAGLLDRVLIQDANSDDETQEVVEKVGRVDERVDFRRESDEGQSDALNRGIGRVASPWVVWLNADDELAPGVLARYAQAARSSADVNVMYGNVVYIDADGDVLHRSYQVPWKPRMTRWGVYVPPTSGTAFRRDLIGRHLLDPNYVYTMDVEWFLRVSRFIQPQAINADSVRFRVWEGSKTALPTRAGNVPARHADERRRNAKRHGLHAGTGGSYSELVRGAVRLEVRTRKAASVARAVLSRT